MRAIINNIIDFYQMQAKALSVLLDNTERALEQSERKRKADEQVQKVESFVRNLTLDLNNMLAKFYFLKERKSRKQEQMTDGQERAVVEFAVFVKALTRNLSSLLRRFQGSQTFEDKIDKEIRELETGVGRKLQEFDKALDETKATLTIRLIKFVQNIAGSFTKLIPVQRIYLTMANSRKSYSPLGESPQNIKEDSPAGIQNASDDELENLFNCSNIRPAKSNDKKSKCLMDLKT